MNEGEKPARAPSGPVMLLYLALGPVVWALHFGALYQAHTLLCARKAESDVDVAFHTIALVATAIALIVLIFVLIGETVQRSRSSATGRHDRRPFYRQTVILLLILSGIGIVWAGATSAYVPACLDLR
jgi:hypothetical protein